ncbi:MAG: BrnA antitoxin family protein [Candidatus Omnitrophica bacterium]|nr:BrnA antitoxin family protein [Candidatus Omnitrophota bacterium]
MKRKIKYTNEPMEFELIKDFLPPPEQLAIKDENVKVTITLSKESIEFFKQVAKKHDSPYQKMIRKVLDSYASHYKKA